MTIKVITGGMQTTVQDLGRIGHQAQGVPVGGAMDRVALRIANLLVGNTEDCGALETTIMGPALRFDTDTLIALTGVNLDAAIEGVSVPLWHPVWAERGTTLRFGHAVEGCRTYIAVGGGIDVPLAFGSRSTYLRAKFGGHEGRALKSGDVLHAGIPSTLSAKIASSLAGGGRRFVVGRWSASPSLRPPYGRDVVVRVTAGAHYDSLSDAGHETLTTATFRVSSSSDRMGYRLEGAEVALHEPMELLSEGTTFGTVQLPPGGAPIVLMADAQTTGGYPRIAEVVTVDLPIVAQLKPGDRLRFRIVSIDEAQAGYLDRERDIRQATAAIALRFSRGS
jgi:antagonist of KipI